MKQGRIYFGAALAVLAVLAATTSAGDKRTPAPQLGAMSGAEAEAFYLGLSAVIWGYPAVFFEDLMRARTRPEIVKLGNPQSAVNQLGLVRELRGPEFKQIATPNSDTLYAQAFCDVSREPLVLSVPRVDDERYYGMQFWDPNGDTFAYVGSRTTGREAGRYALVGPGWKGVLPPGVKRIDCPYDSFAIWGRIGVSGPADVKQARVIQDGLRLLPLSGLGLSTGPAMPDLVFSQKRVALDLPGDLPKGLVFYYKLAQSLRFTPPKQQDVVVADSLAKIGFKNRNMVFDYKSLSAAQTLGLTKAVQFGLHVMDVEAESAGQVVNGWRWSPKSGVMGADYLFRAAFAKWFTGGNAWQEAIYMDGRKDAKGRAFSGSKKYTLRFEPGQMPPVKAFWSLSMYHLSDGSFVENPIQRYAIGDRTGGLAKDEDGGLTIHIQHDEPTDAQQRANWLPAPGEGFYLNLRLYVPDDSLFKGTWAPPLVRAGD